MKRQNCCSGGTSDPEAKRTGPAGASCASGNRDQSTGGEPSCASGNRDQSTGGEPSCASGNRDQSTGGEPSCASGNRDQSTGGEPSCASGSRDQSTGGEPSCASGNRDQSTGGEPSCVSMKTDRSMELPPTISCGGGGEPSCVSMKSDRSMELPPTFSCGEGGEPSCVSMKSDRSMGLPPTFSCGGGGGEPSCGSMKTDRSMELPPTFSCGGGGGEPSCVSMRRDELMASDSGQHFTTVRDVFERYTTSMKKKYENLFEGIKTPENKTLLNRIYTQLYIIEGESEGVNEEHEVLQMERTPRTHLQDSPIHCSEIFKPLPGPSGDTEEENIAADMAKDLRHKTINKQRKPKVLKIRSVLTKGIAGIGKTVSVQKFILDWAEGTANQDVEFMFVLPFRELNLIKDHQYSLHGLLCDLHPELKDLDPQMYDQIKAVFIFDGLDESRIPLNFKEYQKVSDIAMTSSVGVLMTNLITGDLLPSALIWITSRPAAANQIPRRYINRVTEIQGFSDPQKEEYFRKRISDEDQAERIISHIKAARSLHIMCHIPVFCWISATVLQQILKHRNTDIPKTLTEMYLHFLLTQINMKNEKYEENDERDPEKLLESNRTDLLKLAELAFKQLMKGNVMFYEEDLKESSIDVTEASVYSGIFTEIFREECVLHQRKVYCFVHLSFQEFLAAVHVFHCYESKSMEKLQTLEPLNRVWSENDHLYKFLKGAVDKAVKSQNGHLDLFLRFLLGISLESNQRLLQGLLTPTQISSERTTEYIKKLVKSDKYHISTERSINLLLCLSEMNDQSLSREIQEFLNSDKRSEEKLSPGQCSALACMLLISDEVLDELDLRKYNTSEEGYRRLIPALTVCRKALLCGCNLTKDSCEALSSTLQSLNSSLKMLDLSNNNLKDSGVELLSIGLKSSLCKLEMLRLAFCDLGEKACGNLGSALQSVNVLKELDLSNNNLQDSGVELLSAGLKSSSCKLEILRLARCNLGEKACENLGSALQSVNSLKELDLTNNDLQDSGVALLSAGLQSSSCELEILRLSGCMVTDEGCFSLASALKSNASHLRQLDLTYNHPGQSRLKMFSELLEDPHSALIKLQVDHGGEIRIKPGLRKYAVDLTLDPNTVNRCLSLSERNRKVERAVEYQWYPDHPDRFDCSQVLSVEGLTGRCYWEVQWSGWRADVSVSYRGIRRKGGSDDCLFGYTTQSWSLNCRDNSYTVYHNNQRTVLPALPSPSNRVGVYLDWGSGALSFYSISPETHTLTHLHTLYSRFTEPLYAGFRVYHSSVRLCEVE